MNITYFKQHNLYIFLILFFFFFFFLTYHCPNRREIRCLDYNGGGEIYENELPETETAGELNSMFFCFFDLGLFN